MTHEYPPLAQSPIFGTGGNELIDDSTTPRTVAPTPHRHPSPEPPLDPTACS